MTQLRPLIGVVNLSSNVNNDEVKKMVMAVQHQLQYDVAPSWEKDYWFIMFYSDPKTISPRAYPIVIVDNDSTPGALGFHSEQNGKPYGKIMTDPVLNNGGVSLYDTKNPQNISIASVLSHEVIELFVDPYVNLWADGPSIAQGYSYAVEACDPVESNSYIITTSKTAVSVSNFILPSYFDNQGTNEKFDYLGVLNAPFSLAKGGYMVVRNTRGTEQQVFGEILPPKWKLGMKRNKFGSRTQTRMPINKKKKWWQYLF